MREIVRSSSRKHSRTSRTIPTVSVLGSSIRATPSRSAPHPRGSQRPSCSSASTRRSGLRASGRTQSPNRNFRTCSSTQPPWPSSFLTRRAVEQQVPQGLVKTRPGTPSTTPRRRRPWHPELLAGWTLGIQGDQQCLYIYTINMYRDR